MNLFTRCLSNPEILDQVLKEFMQAHPTEPKDFSKTVDLPGYGKKDVVAEIADNWLFIGIRADKEVMPRLSIELPPELDLDKIKLTMEHGRMQIFIPLKAKKQLRKSIPIN